MNKLYLTLLSLLCLCSNVWAQFSDSDLRPVNGLSIGLEKNNSLWVDYGFEKGIHLNVKHTAIADKLPRQSWRIGASYNFTPKYIQLNLNPFITSDWYASFVNVGCSFKLSNLLKDDKFKIGAEYMPYYDNDLTFQNGWSIAAQVHVYKALSLLSEFGRKPDYRIAYKRFYIGLEAKISDLSVKPLLEIPIYDSGVRFDHSKIVVSCFYTFHSKKRNRETVE